MDKLAKVIEKHPQIIVSLAKEGYILDIEALFAPQKLKK